MKLLGSASFARGRAALYGAIDLYGHFDCKELVCSADCLRPYAVVCDEARVFPD